MNKIEKLINKLCPNGVEVKELGEVGELVRGNGLPKTDFTESGVPAIHYGQIYTYYGTFTTETLSYVSFETAIKLKKVDTGDVVITNTSENLEDVGKAVVYLGKIQAVTGGHATIFKPSSQILGKYFAYFTQTIFFTKQKRKYAKGTKVIDVSASDISRIQIPIPPLEIQQEIVSILDTFTTLEAELEAELEKRKQQYEYYRDELLSFGDDVKVETLGSIIKKSYSGATPRANTSKYYNNGNIPWLRTQEVCFNQIEKTSVKVTEVALKETAVKWIPKNCVIVAISGATAGRSAINKIPLTTNQHCLCLDIDSTKANYKYVFYWVKNNYEALKSLGRGARGDLNSSIIKSFRIPLPSLKEQERVVSILDKFDALVNDISIGLPAEIEARRKQYEYYRERLLSFKEQI